jgi:hypothetical protein
VEQRQPPEDHVVGGEPEQIGPCHLGVAGEVGVSELGTLRLASGARGVEDHRGVVLLPLDHLQDRLRGREHLAEHGRVDDDRLSLGLLRAGRRLVREPVPGEDQPAAGVTEIVGDLPRLEQRVHRDDHAAGAQHAVVDHGELRGVGQHDPNPVTRLHPAVAKQASDTRAVAVELPVGRRGLPET